MTRAVTSRAIDYRDFDPLNPDHQAMELMVLRESSCDLTAQLLSARLYTAQTKLVVAAVLRNQGALQSADTASTEVYNGLVATLAPWLAVGAKWAVAQNVPTELVKWESIFGKLDSDEVVEKLRRYAGITGTGDEPGPQWKRAM